MADSSRALIPRARLFGHAVKTATKISPDGRRLSWIAPVDGVGNVWVAAIGDPDAVTRDVGAGVRSYRWAHDSRHLVYEQDADGDETWHVHAVDVETRTVRDLTPFAGAEARVAHLSARRRGEILVWLGHRDPKYHDLYRIDLATGELTLVVENPGVSIFNALIDESFVLRVAVKHRADAGFTVMRAGADGTWTEWIEFAPEDARVSAPALLDATGKIAFFADSRGRDTGAVTRVELATGDSRVLAALTRNPDVYACGVDVVGPANLESFVTSFPPNWTIALPRWYRAIGNPTTEEGRALLRERSPLFQADRIRKPLLIAHGANDARVKQSESDQMVAALKANGIPVTYLLYPDEGHIFARPGNRISFLAVAEGFLATHLGGRADPITREEVEASSIQVLEGAEGVDGLAAATMAAVRTYSPSLGSGAP